MSGRSRIVRPGTSGGATGGGVADPRLRGLFEAASAPVPEVGTAIEARGVVKSTGPTLDAIGSYLGNLNSVVQENVRVNESFSEMMDQITTAMSLASEVAEESASAFDRLHSEQLEKIAHGNKIDEAWDVSRNRNHM